MQPFHPVRPCPMIHHVRQMGVERKGYVSELILGRVFRCHGVLLYEMRVRRAKIQVYQKDRDQTAFSTQHSANETSSFHRGGAETRRKRETRSNLNLRGCDFFEVSCE